MVFVTYFWLACGIRQRMSMSIILPLIILGGVVFASGQERITVQDHRPLRVAVKAVESMIGYPINYEDPPADFSGDNEDVSTPQQHANKSAVRLLVPRRGEIDYVLPVGFRSVDLPTLNLTISGLVSAYNGQDLPGHFRVLSKGGSFTVSADTVRNRGGIVTTVQSPMTTIISGEATNIPIRDVISLCAKLVADSIGKPVYVGTVPQMPWPEVSVSVKRGTARDIFDQVNSQLTGAKLSYELLYQTGYGYMIHVRFVSPKTSDAGSAQTPGHNEPRTQDAPSVSPFFNRTGARKKP
ncbi:MAG: hypothetical protein IT169_15975 [Bryobacterales bacterium]|nr:hypothetical protein [Bryobacterales bacterium]